MAAAGLAFAYLNPGVAGSQPQLCLRGILTFQLVKRGIGIFAAPENSSNKIYYDRDPLKLLREFKASPGFF